MTFLGLEWARPAALVLLLAVPLLAWALRLERRRAPRLRFPAAAAVRRAGPGRLGRLAWLPGALVAAALGLAAVALARPQARAPERREASVEGIDIAIAFDLSTSMKAVDFEPKNRLHVAKEVLKEFIGRRTRDRIGLVVFAGDAYTQAPLTLDTSILRTLVDQLDFGVIEDGTAIGNAIATAVNRLRESTAKSKVIILITDGDNNAGQISPLEAAGLARSFGIKVFAILVGKGGVAPYPVDVDLLGRPIYQQIQLPVNPDLLREIAAATGGAFYAATDRASLEQGLDDILDRLERSRLFEGGSFSRVAERFPSFLLPAFTLAALGLLLGATRLRPFP